MTGGPETRQCAHATRPATWPVRATTRPATRPSSATIRRQCLPQHCAQAAVCAATRVAVSATRRAAGPCVVIQTLYRDRGAYDNTVCARDTACDTAELSHDTALVLATTQRPGRCVRTALAQCTRSLGLGVHPVHPTQF